MNHSLGTIVLILVVYVLAVARITRLINYDKITDQLRLWPARQAAKAKAAADEAADAGQVTTEELLRRTQERWFIVLEFLGCPWCVGWWISLASAVVPVQLIGWPWWSVFGVALAASHLVGISDPLAADEDIEIVNNDGNDDEKGDAAG